MAMSNRGAGARLILLVSAAAAVVVLGASAPPAHLAHIAGSSRKIRMYMANAYVRLNPDGSVTGAADDASPATVLQRSSVSLGQVKIQGVSTCMFLCMDTCGIPYSSREFTDECVFNEKIEQHHYNTYSSAKFSNARRTLYLGMTRKGEVRRVQVRTGTVLGRLSTFTRVLTQSVDTEEATRIHGKTVCHPVPPPSSRPPRPPRCRIRLKGRPRRRKKRPEDQSEDPPPLRRPLRRKCEPGTDCQRRLLIGRKRKSRLGNAAGAPRRLRHRKHRTAVRLKEVDDQEQEQDERADDREDEDDDEDVTMTTEDELLADDHTELFQDINDNE